MNLVITSTDKDVTFSRQSETVYAKNQVSFNVSPHSVTFMAPREKFEVPLTGINVNGVQLTAQNAKGLLSSALFREASGGDGSGTGGDMNNWNQTEW